MKGSREARVVRDISPLSVSIREALTLLPISRSQIYVLIGNGTLIARKCGAKTLIDYPSLVAYHNSLPAMVHAPIPNAVRPLPLRQDPLLLRQDPLFRQDRVVPADIPPDAEEIEKLIWEARTMYGPGSSINRPRARKRLRKFGISWAKPKAA
jgi:hypothetical protein